MRLLLTLLLVFLQVQIFSQWNYLGQRKFSTTAYSRHRIAANQFGTFVASSGASGITAFRFNTVQNRWDTLGSSNFISGIVDEVALKNDTFLICFQDIATRRVGVLQFHSNTWSLVGGVFVSDNASDDDCGMAIVNNQIHVAFQDRQGSSGKATVKRFNGSSWVTVGAPRFTSGNAWDIGLCAVGNTPYISFREFISSSDNKVSVMALNNSNNSWNYIGSRGITTNTPPNTDALNKLLYDTASNNIYLVSEHANYVGIFQFLEGSWVSLGIINNTFIPDYFAFISEGKIALHQGQPVVFVDATLDIFAFKYNGTSWQPFLSTTPITDSGTNDYDVCSYNDSLYIVYSDQRYTETPDGRTSVQRFFSGNVALHSTGLNLTGTRQQQQVALQWYTLSEQGTANFIVEGSTNQADFKPLQRLNASGYTNSSTRYQTLISTTMSNATFFRIKQVNQNGTTQYSNTIYLPNAKSNNLTLNVFPNPFFKQFQIQLHATQSGSMYVTLSNNLGTTVYQAEQKIQSGYNNIIITPYSNLPQGTYFLKVTLDNQSQHLTLVK